MKRTWSGICLFAILVLLPLHSCKEGSEDIIYSIPDELKPYVVLFQEEAKLRGFEIRITNLIVEFSALEDESFCGECLSVPGNPEAQRRIRLSINNLCWASVTNEARESLVFHELTHCILGRMQHKEGQLPNGDLASIMNRSDNGLYTSCVYDIGGGDCDKRYRRTYYIDELFNENTPVPLWGQ